MDGNKQQNHTLSHIFKDRQIFFSFSYSSEEEDGPAASFPFIFTPDLVPVMLQASQRECCITAGLKGGDGGQSESCVLEDHEAL